MVSNSRTNAFVQWSEQVVYTFEDCVRFQLFISSRVLKQWFDIFVFGGRGANDGYLETRRKEREKQTKDRTAKNC